MSPFGRSASRKPRSWPSGRNVFCISWKRREEAGEKSGSGGRSRPSPISGKERRCLMFSFPKPAAEQFFRTFDITLFAVSKDEKQLVFAGNLGGKFNLWAMDLPRTYPYPLTSVDQEAVDETVGRRSGGKQGETDGRFPDHVPEKHEETDAHHSGSQRSPGGEGGVGSNRRRPEEKGSWRGISRAGRRRARMYEKGERDQGVSPHPRVCGTAQGK